MRIEIAGALATGKTTLADALARKGLTVVRESLDTNPYLDPDKDFASNRFVRQSWFVTSKISGIANAYEAGATLMAVDYSMAAERAYFRHNVGDQPLWVARLDNEVAQFECWYGAPDLIVSLGCSVQEQLRRIAVRGRDFEQTHTAESIGSINDHVEQQLLSPSYAKVEILRYRTDVVPIEEICDAIMTKVRTHVTTQSMEALSL